MSIANGIPQIELPVDYPSDMVVRFQNDAFLDSTSTMAEALIPPLSLQRVGLKFTAQATLESEALAGALDFGGRVYAAATGIITPPHEYDGEIAQIFTLRGIEEFEHFVDFNDETLIDLLKKARGRMEADAPQITEVPSDVIGRYYHEKGLHDVALYGAAAVRGMQILINKRMIANQLDEHYDQSR